MQAGEVQVGELLRFKNSGTNVWIGKQGSVMSSLTDTDKRYLQKILGMEGGNLLDYGDATFSAFFSKYKIDIHGQRYRIYGTSKAKKMRAFWELESDKVVAQVLGEMLDSYKAYCDLEGHNVDSNLLGKCKAIVARLGGKRQDIGNTSTEEGFMSEEFKIPALHKLPIEPQVAVIIEQRLKEVQATSESKAHLAVIFLCGSILEGVLLGVAQNKTEKFNRARSSPKTAQDKVKPLHEWSLSQLIDTAHEIGLLKLDVKRFCHGLRDFRNYIHPYEQMSSGFTPDEYTARLCYQVLKAALASLAGER